MVFEPIDANRQAIFTQVDWRAHRLLSVVVAGRVDKSTLHDTQFSPKVALVYRVNPKNSIRLTYNQAFQVANYSEFFLHTRILDSFPIGGFVRTLCAGADTARRPASIAASTRTSSSPIRGSGATAIWFWRRPRPGRLGYTGLIANKLFITVDYYSSQERQLHYGPDSPDRHGLRRTSMAASTSDGNPVTDPRECTVNQRITNPG